VPLVELNGARLWYELAGAGPAVVFLHHGIADARVWDPQWEPFAERFRVVRYDARGYGRSTLPGGLYSHADDLRALLDLLGIATAVLVAASMGSNTELQFALVSPDRVAALVVAPPGGYGAEPTEELRRYGEAEDAALDRGDIEGAVRLNLDFWVAGRERSLAEVDPDVVRRVAGMQRRAFEVQLPVFEGGDPPVPAPAFPDGLGERLGDIGAPTFVIVGVHDASVILETAERIRANVRRARVETIPGTAHVPNLERPREFNELVLGFLGGLGLAH
jgi:pimeloyl-ACP methyl ester carboxylesterase